MANSILTVAEIAKEAAFQVKNMLGLIGRVDTQFKNDFTVKKGTTITYRRPSYYTVHDGIDLTGAISDVNQPSASLTIDKQRNVGFGFSNIELALSIDMFSKLHIQPAVTALINDMDVELLSLYKDVYFSSGTAGTLPANFAALSDLSKTMSDAPIPQTGRNVVLNPGSANAIRKGMTGLFAPSLIEGILKESSLGRGAGMEIIESQNVLNHTAGDWAGALINGVPSSGATTLVMDTFTNSGAAQLKKGDIFSIAGVNHVNPITKQDTGVVMQFVCTADTTVSAGAATVPIFPAMVSTGDLQNVSALPADNAVVTAKATHVANIAFNKNAFSLVTVPVAPLSGGVDMATEVSDGVGITVSKWATGIDLSQNIRLDLLYGLTTSNPNLAVRLLG